VTIIGSGCEPGTTVTIGGVPQVVSVGRSTVLYLTTTAQEAGAVEMVVTGHQGQVETFAAPFEYARPAVFGLRVLNLFFRSIQRPAASAFPPCALRSGRLDAQNGSPACSPRLFRCAEGSWASR
jgi:hypothetical protein